MAAEQRRQEMGLFYKPASILRAAAARWRAVTRMGFARLFVKPAFFSAGKVLGVLRHQRAGG